MAPVDAGVLLIRGTLGIVMLAHGWNHVWGEGGIDGTTRWFTSLGMRPARLHAWLASLTEIGAGALLIVGLVTPVAGAGVLGVMVVAWISNHLRNGFFIFRPGEGYEYVMTLSAAGICVCCTGGGSFSLDAAIGFPTPTWLMAVGAALAGVVGGALLLVTCWRPPEAG